MKRMTMIKDALPPLKVEKCLRIILKRRRTQGGGFETVGSGFCDKVVEKYGELEILETRMGEQSLKIIVK